jgi:Uma2 family endonuclease
VTTAFAPRPRAWARADYERLVSAGILGPGDRVELLEGEIIEMSPEKSRHAAAVDLTLDALRRRLGASHTIRVQHPLGVSETSEPEPDLAVVPGTFRDYQAGHPSHPVLVVEVSESSLALDREHKGSLYARAGLPDYWIVNLPERVLEVYRDPEPLAAAPFGWRYRSTLALGAADSIAPLALPDRAIAVADLLL